jgi:hypothetical protein
MSPHKQWPNTFETSRDVAEALNWIIWKTGGKAQLIIALGPNSISAAINERMDAEEAIAALEAEQDTIARLIRYLRDSKKTHWYAARPDGQ